MVKKKRFIEKKAATTYRLVHRSQRDPLIADENASQRVFVDVSARRPPAEEEKKAVIPEEKVDKFKKLEEQALHGLHFDDDDEYDYMQHLKPRGAPGAEVLAVPEPQGRKKQTAEDLLGALEAGDAEEAEVATEKKPVALPSEVMPSAREEAVGMLALQAKISGPQPQWDPDVIAALDEDFDFETEDNTLNDDFILQALADQEEDEDGSDWETDSDVSSTGAGYSDDEGDDGDRFKNMFGGMPLHAFKEEETKSRFTEYSMSSSILPRNDALQLHDARFEKLYEQYDDDQIGALSEDEEEIVGQNDLDAFGAVFDKFLDGVENQRGQMLQAFDSLEISKPKTNAADLEATMGNAEKDESTGKHVVFMTQETEKERLDREFLAPYGPAPSREWDCESVLSLSSTAYNHPTVIRERKKKQREQQRIQLDKKTGLPVGVFEDHKRKMKGVTSEAKGKDDVEEEEEEDGEEIVKIDTSKGRNKHETPEEKRLRKQAIKEQRKARRRTKKETKLAFKSEEKRQTQIKNNCARNAGSRLT